MTEPPATDPAADQDLLEQEVVAYLKGNPDIVKRHPDLLAALSPNRSFESTTVVDMQQFVVDRLRQQVNDLREAGHSLVHTTRTNMSVQSRTHASALALLEARDFSDLARVFSEDLPINLAVDVVTIGFETNEDGSSALPAGAGVVCRSLPHGFVDETLGMGEAAALRGSTTGDETIFGEGAGLVTSDALVRLPSRDGVPTGLFAAGARDTDTFTSDQGTELIGFLAHVAWYAVARWVRQGS